MSTPTPSLTALAAAMAARNAAAAILRAAAARLPDPDLAEQLERDAERLEHAAVAPLR